MDDGIYIKQIIEGMGERLHRLLNTFPSGLDLFGSLLPREEGATNRKAYSTLVIAYPQVFLEEKSAEYLRKLETSQKHCDELVSLLPDSSAAAAPSKPYREYIASLPAPRHRPPTPKRKQADPTKLAAAQARVLAQHHHHQQQHTVATEKAAALLATKNKTNSSPLPPNKQQNKTKITLTPKDKVKAVPSLALKATKATTMTKTKVVKKTQPPKRVSKIEKLRPKPLTVAEATPTAALQKKECPNPQPLSGKHGNTTSLVVPRTAEKKDEKKAPTADEVEVGISNKDPKTPTIKEMLKEMLTRHKDVILVEPLEKFDVEVVNNTNIDASVQNKPMKETLPTVAAPAIVPAAAGGAKTNKRKEREGRLDHSESENKTPKEITLKKQKQEKQSQEKDKIIRASPTKQRNLKPTHKQAAPAPAPAPVIYGRFQAPVAGPNDVAAALDALTGPFADLYALLDTVGVAALHYGAPLSATGGTNGNAPPPTSTVAAAAKLVQARATAHRMSRLSSEKRNSIGGKDSHVSLMFEMHGGVALFEAAIPMDMELLNSECKNKSSGDGGKAASAAADVVGVYDQAAAVLETCAARGTTAQGPELTVKIIEAFTQRTAACARLRGAILKMKHQDTSSASGSVNGGKDSWKGKHYNKPLASTTKVTDTTTSMASSSSAPSLERLLVQAFNNLESTATKLDSLQQLAIEKNNLAASRAVVALRLMAGEAMNGRPARLWALIEACKASIMKI